MKHAIKRVIGLLMIVSLLSACTGYDANKNTSEHGSTIAESEESQGIEKGSNASEVNSRAVSDTDSDQDKVIKILPQYAESEVLKLIRIDEDRIVYREFHLDTYMEEDGFYYSASALEIVDGKILFDLGFVYDFHQDTAYPLDDPSNGEHLVMPVYLKNGLIAGIPDVPARLSILNMDGSPSGFALDFDYGADIDSRDNYPQVLERYAKGITYDDNKQQYYLLYAYSEFADVHAERIGISIYNIYGQLLSDTLLNGSRLQQINKGFLSPGRLHILSDEYLFLEDAGHDILIDLNNNRAKDLYHDQTEKFLLDYPEWMITRNHPIRMTNKFYELPYEVEIHYESATIRNGDEIIYEVEDVSEYLFYARDNDGSYYLAFS